MTRIQIAPEDFEDLAEGFWFYEIQEAGLGDSFSSHLRADIERLKVTSGVHRLAYRDFHRLLSRVFPFATSRID